MVRLFNNVLVLCTSFEDGITKLKQIIKRCYERGVVLKFAKSWIGFQQVKFFGYQVLPRKDVLDEDRKSTIWSVDMPQNRKSMQRFLGMAVFFSEFVPNYSDMTSKHYDMIAPTLAWERTEDYVAVFERVKEVLCDSQVKHFPNYNLDWILRTDAFDYTVACT